MSQTISAINIEIDDLVCPITLELFRDPVVAEDGHVYEREAITRWILEHGTSPFTREPLDINHLQPDDHLRRLANQRQRSTVSYNARNNFITLPPLRRVPHNNVETVPVRRPDRIIRNSPTNKHSLRKMCLYLILFGIIVGVPLIVYIGIRSSLSHSSSYPYSTSTVTYGFRIISYYSSSLTNSSPIFIRPFSNNTQCYYQAIQVTVSFSGYYRFWSVSQIDMYGCLYNGYFNATNSSINLLENDDDNYGNQQFYFGTPLQFGNYTLVATTYDSGITGNFSVIATGPANITFQSV